MPQKAKIKAIERENERGRVSNTTTLHAKGLSHGGTRRMQLNIPSLRSKDECAKSEDEKDDTESDGAEREE